MDKIKVGIVEDDEISSYHLTHELNSMGYEVLRPCTDYHQAIIMLENEPPDLAVLDIKLMGDNDGIEIANYINKHLDIPFIFLTGSSDAETLNKAKSVKPSAFLVKPFKKADLFAAVELAINNFSLGKNKAQQEEAGAINPTLKDIIFIKEGDCFYKVKFDDILYMNSENVYIVIHTLKRKFIVRASLNEYIKKFDPTIFVRTHQRYIVNISKIDKINSVYIQVNKEEIPISKAYRNEMMKKLNLG